MYIFVISDVKECGRTHGKGGVAVVRQKKRGQEDGDGDGDGVTARSSAVRQRGALIRRRSPLPALRCVRYVIGLQTVLMSLCLNKPHQAFFNSAE